MYGTIFCVKNYHSKCRRRILSTMQMTRNRVAYALYVHPKKDLWKAAFKKYLPSPKDPNCKLIF